MSKLPINLPNRLIKGKSTFTAEWANSIREAIARLDARKPPTQVFSGVSGGASLRALQATCRYDSDNSEWKLKYVNGYVNVSSGAGDGDITPTIDGTAISDIPAPELTVEEGDSIYLKTVATFADPASATVTIEVASSPTSSVSATGFTSYKRISQIFDWAGDDNLTVTNWQGGNLNITAVGSRICFWIS